MLDYLHHNMPDVWRFQVVLDGNELKLRVKEAWAGEKGVVILFRYKLDGEMLEDEDGNPITDVRFGRVTFREIPRGDLGGVVR